ncbi:hypothetical protein [Cryobacterium sp. PH29-G1]|uniref:hypothetical protein n=1 Tax=Cryobacterium sp. PH29-G1 TaxID=3046211 RepID=UPI0024B8D794|nr:hypothetical protein [Cryobacterium sp. PH29-G1]MDJ0347918.1 hypothetical protein [Cryobacterium sp. PH29-G1]
MTQTAAVPASVSRRCHPLNVRTSMLALLALVALLLSVLAMHSAASFHVMGFALPVAASQVDASQVDASQVAVAAPHHGTTAAHPGTAAEPQVGPAVSAAATATAAALGRAGSAMIMAPALMSAAAVVGVVAPLTHNGMLDCALMVMGCVMLLVLAATVMLNRRGTPAHRLPRPSSVLHAQLFAVALPIHRPRLALLGIRRV